jgi:hypothetical protein
MKNYKELLKKDYKIFIKIRGEQYKIIPCHYSMYELFSKYHYLKEINTASKCWVIVKEEELVGFHSSLQFPMRRLDGKTAFRGHRTIIIPKYQGLGIGSSFVNYIASIFINNNKAFYTTTSNKNFGESRNQSELWRATKNNGKVRTEKELERNKFGGSYRNVVYYCHEYVGWPA